MGIALSAWHVPFSHPLNKCRKLEDFPFHGLKNKTGLEILVPQEHLVI